MRKIDTINPKIKTRILPFEQLLQFSFLHYKTAAAGPPFSLAALHTVALSSNSWQTKPSFLELRKAIVVAPRYFSPHLFSLSCRKTGEGNPAIQFVSQNIICKFAVLRFIYCNVEIQRSYVKFCFAVCCSNCDLIRLLK